MAVINLDLRGLTCPLPILRTKKMLKTLGEDDVLKVRLSDSGSMKDFEALCQEGQASLESWAETHSDYTLNFKFEKSLNSRIACDFFAFQNKRNLAFFKENLHEV